MPKVPCARPIAATALAYGVLARGFPRRVTPRDTTEPPPITRVSVSIFQPLIFSVGRDPIEYLLGKRAAMIRPSPGNRGT
jgi:hypothetical protein